jgi:hypothetical protein
LDARYPGLLDAILDSAEERRRRDTSESAG